MTGALLAGPVYPALERRYRAKGPAGVGRQSLGAAATLALFALTVVAISGQTHSPFLYFRF